MVYLDKSISDEKSRCLYSALALSQFHSYNTKKNCEIQMKIFNALLRHYELLPVYVEGHAIPLQYLKAENGRRIQNKPVFESVIDRYLHIPEFKNTIATVSALLKATREICGSTWTYTVHVSRGGIKFRLEGMSDATSRDYSNGAIQCHRLYEIKTELENFVLNQGGVSSLYTPARSVIWPSSEPVLDFIRYTQDVGEELAKCLEGKLAEYIGGRKILKYDYLERAALRYREHCMESKECKKVERVCVDKTMCANMRHDTIWEGDLQKFILDKARELSEDLNKKVFGGSSGEFNMTFGVRVICDNGCWTAKRADKLPVRVIKFIGEPPQIIRLLSKVM